MTPGSRRTTAQTSSVIRDVRSEALGDILKEVSGSAGISQKIRASVKMPSLGKRQEADEDERRRRGARAEGEEGTREEAGREKIARTRRSSRA